MGANNGRFADPRRLQAMALWTVNDRPKQRMIVTESSEYEQPDAAARKESVAPFGQQMLLFIVAGLIVLVDHLMKRYIENWLALNQSWAPWPEYAQYFQFTHVANTGAAFGFFPGGSLFFSAAAIIVAVVIVFYNYNLSNGHIPLRLALGLQLGGALGNLVDRFRLGHVTDFLDFGPWPVFNIADAAIVAGVAVLAWIMFNEPDDRVTEPVLETTGEESEEWPEASDR